MLYSLYAAHPITMNPFHCVLVETFVHEKEHARIISTEGGVSPNEQLIWVLWKILRGDGSDVRVLIACRIAVC